MSCFITHLSHLFLFFPFHFALSTLDQYNCFACSDYVRLTFGEDDKPLYFPNDEYFGIGLFRHQDFATNKTALTWEHDTKCYDYTEFEEGMFRDSNVKTASVLFMISMVLSAITLLALIVLKWTGRDFESFGMMCLVAMISTGAAILQEITCFDMLKKNGNAICNVNLYGPDTNGNEAWLVSYPADEFPNVAYMRFFQRCTFGNTGIIAIAGFVAQFATCLLVVANHFLFDDADVEIETTDQSKRREESIAGDLESSKEEEYEESCTAANISYNTNPLGPLARAAPQSAVADESFVDDISFDQTKDDAEDQVMFEDDLSMAVSEQDQDDRPIENMPSLMSSKALQSGRF